MTPHVLPPLPYDYAALQPWIDERIVRRHYDYHRTRVDALNAAEAQLAAQRDSAGVARLRDLQRLVTVGTSEHLMHCLFWEIMGPNQGGVPGDVLRDQIRDDFGSFADFKSQFCTAATTERSEWIALVWQPSTERLGIRAIDYHELRAESVTGILLALDVNGHAYDLQYQDRRAEYAHNWWNAVHWPRVAERFAAATHSWPHYAKLGSTQRPGPQRRDGHALPLNAGAPRPCGNT